MCPYQKKNKFLSLILLLEFPGVGVFLDIFLTRLAPKNRHFKVIKNTKITKIGIFTMSYLVSGHLPDFFTFKCTNFFEFNHFFWA